MFGEIIRSTRSSRFLVAVSLSLWTACAHSPTEQGAGEPEPQVAEGAFLVLTHPLPVPGDVWSVYFQDGELLRFGAIDDHRLYCELYLNGARGADWQVLPDRFLITRISSGSQNESVLPSQTEFRLAWDRDQSVYTTVLSLHSATQPDVRELRCHFLFDTGWNAFPSARNIRQALGDFFDIEADAAKAPGRL
jgi:hypothetical protein